MVALIYTIFFSKFFYFTFVDIVSMFFFFWGGGVAAVYRIYAATKIDTRPETGGVCRAPVNSIIQWSIYPPAPLVCQIDCTFGRYTCLSLCMSLDFQSQSPLAGHQTMPLFGGRKMFRKEGESVKNERVDMSTPPPTRLPLDAKVSTPDSRHVRAKDEGGGEDQFANNGRAPSSQFYQQHSSRPQIRGGCAENYAELPAAKAAAREIVMTEAEKQKLVFHCQQAQGSPTGLISGFSNVKELYEKIAECYDFTPNEVSYWKF